mmetsp:Transcript_9772/g.31374  ORF Transcript_9772/g.31374 Transcript_9772/m.31374 type:complete len:220 (+) Transcript_9772:483-1142(+)
MVSRTSFQWVRFLRAPAAASLASGPPRSTRAQRGLTARFEMSSTWLTSSRARFQRTVAAACWAALVPWATIQTRGLTPCEMTIWVRAAKSRARRQRRVAAASRATSARVWRRNWQTSQMTPEATTSASFLTLLTASVARARATTARRSSVAAACRKRSTRAREPPHWAMATLHSYSSASCWRAATAAVSRRKRSSAGRGASAARATMAARTGMAACLVG